MTGSMYHGVFRLLNIYQMFYLQGSMDKPKPWARLSKMSLP